MNGGDWRRVKEVLTAALEAHPDARSALLDEACASDPVLREEVEALLRADAAAGTFIEEPAVVELGLVENAREHPEPNIGRTLGPYCIEQRIGHGGMGTVYLARRADNEFERRVAIKMIRRGMDSEQVIRRFRHERQILASLDHPHIAALFDGGTTADGLPYFVMEHVAGTPIDRYADEHLLSTPARLELCLDVLDAVQHAHEHHVVHRDLKPSNVLVTADGHPKLLDFGIAKILDPGGDGADAAGGASTFTSAFPSAIGPMTPDYASPEQVRGETVTAASDVYALGLMLYELLTGHRPYRLTKRTPEEMVRVVCQEDPERPSLVIDHTETTTLGDGTTETATPATVSRTRDGSPELLRKRLSGPLDDIVMKALRKEPERRYASVAAMGDDVRRYLAEQPVLARRGARRYRAQRFLGRHRTALSAAALVVAVGFTAIVAARVMLGRSAGTVHDPAGQTAQRPSVAVVEFRNLSQRPADQWLSTALAEMLTSELAGDGQFRVVPAELVARAQRDQNGDDAARFRTLLAADYLVRGQFATTGGEDARSLRIDVRVLRAAGDPIVVAGVGDEARLFAMIADAGRELRGRLGLKASTPEATSGARAAFPRGLEATKLFAEGTARLRRLEAGAARDLLEQAASREPDNPLIQAALASAWTALGYDSRAEAAVQKAFNASGALNREDRLTVEGRLYEAQRQWARAVDVYRTLWGFFADNVEYGLRLADAQTTAGRGKDALVTVDAMRHLAPPQNQDPRIDLAESQADSSLADFPRELAAIKRAIDKSSHTGSKQLLARARLLEGRSYYNQGQPDAAKQSLVAARQLFIEAGDKSGAASALNSLASVLSDQQDISTAQRMYEASLSTSEEIGDRRGMSSALNNLGVLLKDERRFVEARQAHERSLALRKEIDDQNWTAVSLSNIGVVLFEQDRFSEAATYYKQSLAISRAIGDKRGQVRALHNLAIVEREVGNVSAARAGFEESLATRAEIGDKRGGAMGRVELGIVLLAQGELGLARQTEEEAVRFARDARLKPGEAQALFQLGEIAAASGDFAAARGHHEQALALRREMKETRTVLESEFALAELAFADGRIADAEGEILRLGHDLEGEPSSPLRVAVVLLTARTALARHDVDGASQALTTARRLAQQTERSDLRTALVMGDAELDVARGRMREARERLRVLRATQARSGLVLAEFETRLLLLQIDRAEGRSSYRADAGALEKDAQARQAGSIVRRVEAL